MEGERREVELARARVAELETALARLRRQIRPGCPGLVFPAQPDIDATVVTVNLSGLVVLDTGSQHGVEKGFAFDIYSHDTYKGLAVVQDVSQNTSSALIHLTVPGQTIRLGDSATTNL